MNILRTLQDIKDLGINEMLTGIAERIFKANKIETEINKVKHPTILNASKILVKILEQKIPEGYAIEGTHNAKPTLERNETTTIGELIEKLESNQYKLPEAGGFSVTQVIDLGLKWETTPGGKSSISENRTIASLQDEDKKRLRQQTDRNYKEERPEVTIHGNRSQQS